MHRVWVAAVVTTTAAWMLLGPTVAAAQTKGRGDWASSTKIEPAEDAKTTIIPRAAGPSQPAGNVDVSLSAILIEGGEPPISQGLVWRIFQPVAPGPGAALAKPRLIGTWREAAPLVKLPPGDYLVNVSFGRAHLTRKISVKAGAAAKEQFILNAGGLRLAAVLDKGEPLPAGAVAFDVYSGDSDQGARSKIVSGAKPGLILRLNAGLYQVVSTYGDANAVVRADVSVEAGKLTEAVVTHTAAKVTLKLVNRAGGEAIADTQWTVQTAQGEMVRESMGALPSHVLAAGTYTAIAKNGGRVFRREFSVTESAPMEIEVVMR